MIALQRIVCSLFLFTASIYALEKDLTVIQTSDISVEMLDDDISSLGALKKEHQAALVTIITHAILDPLSMADVTHIEKRAIIIISRLLMVNENQATETLDAVQKILPEMHFDHFINRVLSRFIFTQCIKEQDSVSPRTREPIYHTLQTLVRFGATVHAQPMFYDFCSRGGQSLAAVIPPIYNPDELNIREPEKAIEAYERHQRRGTLRTLLIRQEARAKYFIEHGLSHARKQDRITLFYQEIFKIFGETRVQEPHIRVQLSTTIADY